MDKIYNYDQYLGMSLDFSVIVNSTLDLKPGSILCIDNEDIEIVSNTNLNVVSITPPAAEEEPEIEELEDEEGEDEIEGEEGDDGATTGQEGDPKDQSEEQSGES